MSQWGGAPPSASGQVNFYDPNAFQQPVSSQQIFQPQVAKNLEKILTL